MTAAAADPTIRRQVLTTARRLLAKNTATPVREIARAAGVSRATFYRHFGSRSAVLAAIAYQPPPDARTRILEAAAEMLLGTSLAALSMDELARVAGVSRGTLYRLYPGKPALLRAMIKTYSPFDAVLALLAERGDEPPSKVLPAIGRTVAGLAQHRLGLMRAVFHEATSGSPASLAGVRPILEPALGALTDYIARHMAAGRLRPMEPFFALQTFVGPIYFHLMTRPVAEAVMGLRTTTPDAVEQLVAAVLSGLVVPER